MGRDDRVIYLTSPPTDERVESYRELGLGVMITPERRGTVAPDWVCWAADNGCFSESPARPFVAQEWIAWLAALPTDRCLFATAPDVLGDAAATWARSEPWLQVVRSLGFSAALVAQDGFDADATDWSAFDCLFVGGTDEFKLGPAFALVGEARARGKWVHIGRVNSERRWRAFDAVGADSADGNLLKFGPDTNTRRLRSWFSQPTLRLP